LPATLNGEVVYQWREFIGGELIAGMHKFVGLVLNFIKLRVFLGNENLSL